MSDKHELPLDGTDEIDLMMVELYEARNEIDLDALLEAIIDKKPTADQITQMLAIPGVDQDRLLVSMLANKPQAAYVREVVERYPELREAAADWLLANNPSGFDIRLVIQRVRTRRRAAVELLLQRPSVGSDLHFAMQHVAKMRDQLFDHFISRRRSAMSLGCVMYDFERYRPHLRQLMSEWNISEEQLLDGIQRGKCSGPYGPFHDEIREQIRRNLGWT